MATRKRRSVQRVTTENPEVDPNEIPVEGPSGLYVFKLLQGSHNQVEEVDGANIRVRYVPGDTITTSIDLAGRFGRDKFAPLTDTVVKNIVTDIRGMDADRLRAYAILQEPPISLSSDLGDDVQALRSAIETELANRASE